MNKRFRFASVFCVMVLFASGCGPSTMQITGFGNATSAIAIDAAEGLRRMDEAVVSRNLLSVAYDTSLSPKDLDFAGALSTKSRTARLATLEALGGYATGLKTLAEADYRKDIDAASKDLYGSLKNLSSDYQTATGAASPIISDAQLGLIATAVDGIGAAINEAKKRKAIHDVVIAADPAVQLVTVLLWCEYLPAPSDPTTKAAIAKRCANIVGTGAVADELHTSLETPITILQAEYNRSRKTVNMDNRLKQLAAIRDARAQWEAARPFATEVAEASLKVGEAHAALVHAVDTQSFSTTDAMNAVGDLNAYAKSIESFRKSLDDQATTEGSTKS
jgi:hypothetical protein